MATTNGTVLVLEDDDDLREALLISLGHAGIDAVGFRDAESAIREWEAAPHRAGLIVLDLGLPSMSGEEFLRSRWMAPGLTRVPVIVITGRRRPSERLRELGVLEVLTKPFESTRLVEAVRTALGRAGD